MQKAITCINCGEVVAANPCLKGYQSYCNKNTCQNARKRAWYQAKIASDSEYAERQDQCKRRWRKNKPAHKYQNHYRQTHSDYVKQNREQQKERNRTYWLLTQETATQTIVKIDALASASSSVKKPNIYKMKILTPNVAQKIVKIDTLIVQIQPCQFTGSGVVP